MRPWHALALVAVGLVLAIGLERSTFAAAELAPALIGAALLYAGSHVLRVLRIIFLLGHSARSLRGIAAAHLTTAPVAALLPFKLGELARIGAFAAESRSPLAAIGAVWVERTFDAFVLALMAALTAWLYPEYTAMVATVAILAVVFLGLTTLAIFVLPENIDAAKHFLIVRYTSQASLNLIKAVHALGGALDLARQTVNGKIATLTVTTLFIWTLEAAALWAISDAVLGAGSPGLLTVLSDAFRPLAETTPGLAEHLATHRAMVVAVLLAVSTLGAAAISLPVLARTPAEAR